MPIGVPGRIFSDRVTLRFAGPERAELDEAVRLSPVAWKGLSHHLRQACLDWARAAIASQPHRQGHKRRRKGQTARKGRAA
jgi:hypothetical protein